MRPAHKTLKVDRESDLPSGKKSGLASDRSWGNVAAAATLTGTGRTVVHGMIEEASGTPWMPAGFLEMVNKPSKAMVMAMTRDKAVEVALMAGDLATSAMTRDGAATTAGMLARVVMAENPAAHRASSARGWSDAATSFTSSLAWLKSSRTT